MLVFKMLHVLSMVTMVTAFVGCEIFYAAAIRSGNVGTLAWVQRTVEKTGAGAVAVIALFLGVIFGLLTAANGGFDYAAGWLIAAYVLVGAFLVNAVVLGEKVVRLGKEAVEADAGKRSSEQVAQDMPTTHAVSLLAINILIFGALVADMVLKPF